MQTVGLSHLSLDTISVDRFLKVALRNRKENLRLDDFRRREINKLDRKKIIGLPLIEQQSDQFSAVKALTLGEGI